MRVTQSYSTQSLLRQVNSTRERISLLQRNLSTGKRINQISDDPANIETALQFRSMLKLNKQFEDNTERAAEFLAFSSTALHDSANVIMQIRELTIQGADSVSDDEFQAFVEQINELLNNLVDMGNTTFKGRYIFGGTNVNNPPFSILPDLSAVTVNPEGIDGALKSELGEGKIEQYNITGQEAFLDNIDIFQTITDLRDEFINRDTNAINALIPQLDDALDQVLEANTRAGAKINRLDLLLNQYQNEDLRLQEFLSSVEDADIPRTILDLQGEQLALEIALKTLAQTVGTSLVDFI